jgi:hypothetical protein
LRPRVVLPILVVLAVLVGGGYLAVRAIGRHLPDRLPITLQSQICVVDGQFEGQSKVVDLDPEQMANAATIAAVGITRKVPPRAIVVALAAAQQESKLYNLPEGDRDSVGLFQQRPSQGWGSQGQILDPRYSAGKFFDALVKVPGWETMQLATAAQAVQKSGHPSAYQRWEDQAATLARAFTGAEPGLLSCSFPEPTVAAAPAKVMQLLDLELPATRLAASAQVGELRATTPWATAGWVVAKADRLGIEAVALDGRRWTRTDGWRVDSSAPAGRIRFEVAQIPPSA